MKSFLCIVFLLLMEMPFHKAVSKTILFSRNSYDFVFGKEPQYQAEKIEFRQQNLIYIDSFPNALINQNAFEFTLPDVNGKLKSLSDFKGKVIVVDFWFTGCPGCLALAPKLMRVEDHFRNKPVVFITVSIDKNIHVWQRSVNSGKYTSMKAVNLFTEGQGKDHPIIENFHVQAYPTLYIIDKKGIFVAPSKDPRKDNGKDLISVIQRQISTL